MRRQPVENDSTYGKVKWSTFAVISELQGKEKCSALWEMVIAVSFLIACYKIWMRFYIFIRFDISMQGEVSRRRISVCWNKKKRLKKLFAWIKKFIFENRDVIRQGNRFRNVFYLWRYTELKNSYIGCISAFKGVYIYSKKILINTSLQVFFLFLILPLSNTFASSSCCHGWSG